MKGYIKYWYSGLISISLVLGLITLVPLAQANSATQRPIEDFVSTQGTFCIDDGMGGCFLFVPPIENFFGLSDPKANLCMSIDYAGLADAWISSVSGGGVSFGTTFEGTVTERPLTDGRAEVTVRLHTKNALTWVIDGCEDFATNPLLFGHRAPDVLAGQDPALGEISVQVKFINTAPGAPLPDLLQLCLDLARGQEGPSFISFNARADGTFRKAFGVPEGTPGRAHSIQTGLFMTKSKGATEGFCAAQEDGFFPAERIHLHVVGQ